MAKHEIVRDLRDPAPREYGRRLQYFFLRLAAAEYLVPDARRSALYPHYHFVQAGICKFRYYVSACPEGMAPYHERQADVRSVLRGEIVDPCPVVREYFVPEMYEFQSLYMLRRFPQFVYDSFRTPVPYEPALARIHPPYVCGRAEGADERASP